MRKSLVKQGQAISIKTFSKAIHNLVNRGELEFLERGREKWYAPADPTREQTREVYAAAEIAKIRMAAPLGVLQDSLRGWAYFGAPPSLGRRMQKPFREAAEAFQGEIDGIFEGEVAKLVRFLRLHTRGKLRREEFERGAKALSELVSAAGSLNLYNGAQSVVNAFVERISPTALGKMTEQFAADIEGAPEPAVRFAVLVTGLPEQKVRAMLVRETKRNEALWRLLALLPPARARKAAETLQSLVVCRAQLCAVVR